MSRSLLLSTALFFTLSTTFLANNPCVDCDVENSPLALDLAKTEMLAMKNNRNIQAARYTLIEAIEGYYATRAGWFPVLTVQGISGWQDPSNPSNAQKVFNGSSVELNQQLLNFPLIAQTKISNIEVDSARADLATLINDTLFQVRKIYYQIVMDLKQIEIQRINVDLFTANICELQKRGKDHLNSEFDIAQGKVALNNALPPYYTAIQQWRTDLNSLAEVLGMDHASAQNIIITDPDYPLKSLPFLEDKLLSIATCTEKTIQDSDMGDFLTFQVCKLNNALSPQIFTFQELEFWSNLTMNKKPALLKQRLNVDLAKANITAVNSEYTPELSAQVFYGSVNPINSYWNSQVFNQTYYLEGQVSLTWTLFDGPARVHKVRQARAGVKANQVTYEQTVQDALLDVRNKFYDIEQNLYSYTSASESVDIAAQSINVAKVKLASGEIRTLMYRQSVDDFTQANTALNQAAYNLLVSYYALLHASGVDITDDMLNPCL